MNPTKLLVLPFLLATAGTAAAAPRPLAAVPAAPAAPSICQATASAARQAARRDAQAEYWIAVAQCLNAPQSCDCEDEAEDALEEALDLADDQYQARLQVCQLIGQGAYNPGIDPDDFSTNVNNSYFPLVPGRTLVYQTQTADGLERDEVTTLPGTVEINGVECRRVHDVVSLDGVVVEDTIDFYAQHHNGAVWYFGEISQSLEDGLLDNIDGSWRFGKDGAKPGIIMRNDPHTNDAYRQEFLVGEAEDVAKVLAVNQTVQVHAGTFQHCIKTKDWSPMEPGHFEFKYYAPGIGVVLEVDPDSGERLELQEIRN